MAAGEGPITAEVVAMRASHVRERIERAGGDPAAIRLVAVTKGFDGSIARAALDAGLFDLGENYAQELVAKAHDLEDLEDLGSPAPLWHFMGRLQTNKVRHLASLVGLWQSLDREELVREVARRAPGAAVLIQLNLSGEAHKGGCDPDRTATLVHLGRDLGLEVRGLMGVGPAGPPSAARTGFDLLVSLAEDLGLPERSIGMSSDLDVAVAAGATMIRIGRDLFGPRPPRPVDEP